MTRTLRRFATAVAIGLAVVLVGGGVAGATTNVLTDPVGDATLCHNYYANPVVVTCPSVQSDPTIDIVDADIDTSSAGDLVARLHVLDLDDPFSTYKKDTRYSFATYLEQGTVVQLTAERHGDATVGKLYVAGPSGGSTVLTPVWFAFSNNRVRWDLPLSVLNERLAIACASCAEVTAGTVLTYFSMDTSASQLSAYTGVSGSETSGAPVSKGDRAFSEATYTIGS